MLGQSHAANRTVSLILRTEQKCLYSCNGQPLGLFERFCRSPPPEIAREGWRTNPMGAAVSLTSGQFKIPIDH